MLFRFFIFFFLIIVSLSAHAVKPTYILNWTEFKQLLPSHRAQYIARIRHAFLEMESAQNRQHKTSYGSLWTDAFMKRAFAADPSPGAACVYGGHLSQLVKMGPRLVCERPPKGSCADGQIQCNPSLYGDNLCVSAGALATSQCHQKALPPEDVAASLSKKDWDEISKINEYCHNPQTFQKLICDKFYEARMAALNEHNPCREAAASCEHTGLNKTIIQLCEIIEKTDPQPDEEKAPCPDDVAPNLEQIKECLGAALDSALSSALFLDEIADILALAGIDLFGLTAESTDISNLTSNYAAIQKNPDDYKTLKATNKRFLNEFATKYKSDSNFRNQVLDNSSRVLYTIYSGKDVMKNNNNNNNETPEDSDHSNTTNYFAAPPLMCAASNEPPPYKKICSIIGGIGGDAIAAVLLAAITPATGGTSAVVSAAKIAKITAALSKLAKLVIKGPEIVKGFLKLFRVPTNVIERITQVADATSIESYVLNLTMCKLGNEARCESNRRFEVCVTGSLPVFCTYQ